MEVSETRSEDLDLGSRHACIHHVGRRELCAEQSFRRQDRVVRQASPRKNCAASSNEGERPNSHRGTGLARFLQIYRVGVDRRLTTGEDGEGTKRHPVGAVDHMHHRYGGVSTQVELRCSEFLPTIHASSSEWPTVDPVQHSYLGVLIQADKFAVPNNV